MSGRVWPLLFLTSRILETEPYRSDRFEVGFGLATRNRLKRLAALGHRGESSCYLIPGDAAGSNHALRSFQSQPVKSDWRYEAAADARNRLKKGESAAELDLSTFRKSFCCSTSPLSRHALARFEFAKKELSAP